MINRRFSTIILTAFLAVLPAFAQAQCTGTNLIDQLTDQQHTMLDARMAQHPYPQGNMWRATKGDSTIHVIGTIHLFEPRFQPILDRIAPLVGAADQVFLEMARDDMERMQRKMMRSPDLLFLPSGPSLIDLLPEPVWQNLTTELSKRGIPGVMAAKLQPWYASLMLSIPPCAMASVSAGEGMDYRIMEMAEAAGAPVHSIEDPETALALLTRAPQEDQIRDLIAAVGMAGFAEDSFVTLTDFYQQGRHRELLEVSIIMAMTDPSRTPEQWEAIFVQFEQDLMTNRNLAWMDVLLPATGNQNTVVAVGALHLAGEFGILNLLDQAGYSLTRLD